VAANAESTKNSTLPLASDGATVAVNVTADPTAGVVEEALKVVEVEASDSVMVSDTALDVLAA
jgi:hypothetical protein